MKKLLLLGLLFCITSSIHGVTGEQLIPVLKELKGMEHSGHGNHDRVSVYNLDNKVIDNIAGPWQYFDWKNVSLYKITNNSSYHYNLQGPSGFRDVIIPRGKTTVIPHARETALLSNGDYTLVPYKVFNQPITGTPYLSNQLHNSGDTQAEYRLSGGIIKIQAAGLDAKNGLLVSQTESYGDQQAGSFVDKRTHAVVMSSFVRAPGGVEITLSDLKLGGQSVSRTMPRVSGVQVWGLNLLSGDLSVLHNYGSRTKDLLSKINNANMMLQSSNYSTAHVPIMQNNSVDGQGQRVLDLPAKWLWADVPQTGTVSYTITNRGGKSTSILTGQTKDFSNYVSGSRRHKPKGRL